MLSSAPIFCRSDTVSDLEQFYLSVLKLFDDMEELKEVDDLLEWWNWYDNVSLTLHSINKLLPSFRQVFCNWPRFHHPISVMSALGLIKAKHRQLIARSNNSMTNGQS